MARARPAAAAAGLLAAALLSALAPAAAWWKPARTPLLRFQYQLISPVTPSTYLAGVQVGVGRPARRAAALRCAGWMPLCMHPPPQQQQPALSQHHPTLNRLYPATPQVYFTDLFDTPASTISWLKAKGVVPICYFSTQYENWR